MPKTPEYALIAATLKTEVLAGRYGSDPLPGTAALAERFDVNLKTAARAVQHLVAEGILMARPGMSAIPVPAAGRRRVGDLTDAGYLVLAPDELAQLPESLRLEMRQWLTRAGHLVPPGLQPQAGDQRPAAGSGAANP
jgi:DNA-binding transcriptional MocR family regulator